MMVINPWMGVCNNKIGVILRSGGLSNRELEALDTRITDRFVCGQWGGGGERSMSSGGSCTSLLEKNLFKVWVEPSLSRSVYENLMLPNMF